MFTCKNMTIIRNAPCMCHFNVKVSFYVESGGGGEKKAMKNLRTYTHRFYTRFRPVIVMRIELLRNPTSNLALTNRYAIRWVII